MNSFVTLKRWERIANPCPEISDLAYNIYSFNGFNRWEDIKENFIDIEPIPSEKLRGAEEFRTILLDAMEKNLHIVFVGDYDADGVTATSIMVYLVRAFGYENFSYYIPHRERDGYGLKNPIIDKIKDKAQLIITIDNGIKSKDAVEYAKSFGIDVVVTDHHEPPHEKEELPNGLLTINPHLDEDYPFQSISGATVAFKLATYVLMRSDLPKGIVGLTRTICFELACLSIVSDVMPLIKENRSMLKTFLSRVNEGKVFNQALKALINLNELNYATVDEMDLGFKICPCINAIGRLSDASIVVEALIATTYSEAHTIVAEMLQVNQRRKELTKEYVDLALEQVNEADNVICVYLPNISEGIIGIIAGKLTERFGRPSFVFTDSIGGILKGSARSPENFHLHDETAQIFKKHPELTVGFGGHAKAMGLSLKDHSSFHRFKELINEIPLKDPVELYYFELKDISELEEYLSTLHQLKPYGEMFRLPTFKVKVFYPKILYMGKDQSHTRIIAGDYQFLFFNNVVEQSICLDIYFNINTDNSGNYQLLVERVVEQ